MGQPWPKKKEELDLYIRSQVEKEHDYNSSAEAVANIILATFNYYGSQIGITGLQAHWAAMKFLAEVYHIKGPMMVISADKALYPQYNLEEDFRKFKNRSMSWLREQAKKKLEENPDAAPRVIEHWKKLAEAE